MELEKLKCGGLFYCNSSKIKIRDFRSYHFKYEKGNIASYWKLMAEPNNTLIKHFRLYKNYKSDTIFVLEGKDVDGIKKVIKSLL